MNSVMFFSIRTAVVVKSLSSGVRLPGVKDFCHASDLSIRGHLKYTVFIVLASLRPQFIFLVIYSVVPVWFSHYPTNDERKFPRNYHDISAHPHYA